MQFASCLLAMAVAIVGFRGPATGAEFVIDGRKFTVPDGFVVERVAGPPLVDRPITCDFDERGRLYVADSSGSNEPVARQLAERPHRVVRLEDTDGDGRFDKRTIFADKLMFPEGTMWYRGSLYVAAPPSIWKLTDTNDDGVADRREEWFAGVTLTGCANDLHGPYRGRDGWIYWCKGAFAEQTHDLPGRPGWKTRASHIFRARPDGSLREPVLTGGMDNPVDVAFTPEGERILSCTFLQHPGGGRRDGLIHALYGGVYGKDHDVLRGHPRTGDLLPPLSHLGPAAPCGLELLESSALGADWRGNLLCCQFNLRKVSRHVLAPRGATYATRDEDFLVGESMDFHPTDVVEDGDGSALVCDTGGWYKLCCPTSQFHKPDVLGAIYRVRRRNAEAVADPRGLTIDWAKLAPAGLTALLDDSRPAVRERTMETLTARGEAAREALTATVQRSQSVVARQNAIWTCSRLGEPWAIDLLRQGLRDDSASVRHAAALACAAWRAPLDGRSPAPWSDTEPAVRRALAEWWGRVAPPDRLGPAIDAAAAASDRALEHSFLYAAIEARATSAAREALHANDPRRHRAGMLALDAIPKGDLKPNDVLPALTAADAPLRDAAWAIVGRRPEWGASLAMFVETQVKSRAPGWTDAELTNRLAMFADQAAVADLIARAARGDDELRHAQASAVEAMAKARLSATPRSWTAALCELLDRDRMTAAAVAGLRARAVAKEDAALATAALTRVATNERLAVELRLHALDALPGTIANPSPLLFTFLMSRLDNQENPGHRGIAVGVLARMALGRDELAALCDHWNELGPFDIARLLPLYEQRGDAAAFEKVISTMETTPGAAQLAASSLRPLLDKLPEPLRPRGEKLTARLDSSLAQQRALLDATIAAVRKHTGDIQRGRAVFHSQRAGCVNCHAIAYVGGLLGPDLTRIGQIRQEQDLLESIVLPSASFVRSYEPTLIVTRSGQQHSGIVRHDQPDGVTLATAHDKEVRVPRDEIEEIRPGAVSVMPQGLEKILSPQELADLAAFLKNCR